MTESEARIDQRQEVIARARAALQTRQPSAEADFLALAKELEGKSAFGWARRVYERLGETLSEDHDKARFLRQRRAFCTYRDPEKPLRERLDLALLILARLEQKAEPLTALEEANHVFDAEEDPETLGLVGAIYKRKWEAEGHTDDLEKAHRYYQRGHDLDMALVNDEAIVKAGLASPDGPLDIAVELRPGHKYGYPGINAAFVLDLLDRPEEANAIRQTLVDYLGNLLRVKDERLAGLAGFGEEKKWIEMTLAQACFGLERYRDAGLILQGSNARHKLAVWELESTARQLARLARVREVGHEPLEILQEFIGEDALSNLARGKIGLALSGGGFRASFFHIGVLAKLAELDVLRHVEVISCVSGGAILGAHYYLEVRHLLETKNDADITRQDYVDIVDRIARRFTKGVQANIRTRLVLNPFKLYWMAFSRAYSRTLLAGELYEKYLFSQVPDGNGQAPRFLSELFIQPPDEEVPFDPDASNWQRRNQVPKLVLNATVLNTGHNWQFTTAWMGESLPATAEELDGTVRLRRLYYHQAPPAYRSIRLGTAVAASACVPAIFEPILFADLYPGYSVRLVDGGVHDNQGTSSLLEQDCSVILVSDASGRMGADPAAGGGVLRPAMRSSSVSMERVRQAQLRELEVRHRAGHLPRMMTVHLKKDLNPVHLDWVGCDDPLEDGPGGLPPWRLEDLTPYGVRRDLQALIADMRTDLDSFSDVEAAALMTSGYLMTGYTATRTLEGVVGEEIAHPFPFLETGVKEAMTSPEPTASHPRLQRILEISRGAAFRVFHLAPRRAAAVVLVLLAMAAGVASLLPWWLGLVLLPLALPAVAAVHLLVFDRIFLRAAGLDRLNSPTDPG